MDVWKGDWGLPSIDLKCLHVMAYVKFSGAPLKLNKTNNPWNSPTGELPVYHQKSGLTLTKFEDIMAHLSSQNYNADFELTSMQQADLKAYTRLLQEKLLPGLLYTWWIDSKNYIDLTRPWYARALPFPLNFFVPGQMQRTAKNYLINKYNVDDDDLDLLETKVFRHSQECLNLLSDRLEDRDFFFGKSPTSLDALIFAYLAPLLKVPFPSAVLQNHLKGCDNLMKFVVRVLHRYFPSTEEGKESKQAQELIDDFPNKRRNQILAGLTAFAAMVCYALITGLVQVDIADDVGGEEDQVENLEDSEFKKFYDKTEDEESHGDE